MASDKKAKVEESAEDKEKDKAAATGEGEAGAEGGEAAPAGRFSKLPIKKIVLFGVLPLLLIGGGAGTAYFMGAFDKLLGKVDCAEVKEGDEHFEECAQKMEIAKDFAPGKFIDIPNLIVNLNTASKNPHFLKVSLKVELEDPASEQMFNDVMPRVIDQFQTYLRELRMEDLRGSSGLYRMKIELLNRVRAAAPEIKVRDVLFQEILVQ